MEKKTVGIALTSGLVAGLVSAIIVCTTCSYMPCRNKMMPQFPPHEMMMKHKMHHKGVPMGFHHKKGAEKWKEPTAEMKEHFAKKLGLSDEQKATLEQYRNEDMAKMKPLFDEMKRIKGEIKELRKANRARFESVLTDEQKEILQQMKAKHHKHGFKPKAEAESEVKAEAEEPAVAEAVAAAAVGALAE